MLIVVAYDIPDDYRREKVARALLDFGERVQKSVFECHLTARQRDRMRTRVERLLRADLDLIRYYTLCETCRARTEGLPSPHTPPPATRIV